MRFLRKNTAVIITVGPFYDKTTGVDIETALTITNERITLTADTDDGSAPTNILDNIAGATAATANDLNYITGNDAGMMQLELAAADTNRLGRMFLSITDAANHVPVFHEFQVVNAAIYDAFFATSGGAIPNVAAAAVGGLVTAPTTANTALADATRLLGTAIVAPNTAGLLDVNAKEAGATAWNSGAIKTTSFTAGAIDAAAIAANAIGASELAADAVAEIADAVWDEDATGHQTGGTFGQAIGDPGADTATIYAAVITNAAGVDIAADLIAVKADTAAILVDTGTTLDGRIPAALVGGRIDASVGAIAANAITAASLAADAGAEIADAILDRDMSTGTDSGSTTVRTPRQALRAIRNKWSISGVTITYTKEDDATASWTSALSTDAAAVPIISSDPAGP